MIRASAALFLIVSLWAPPARAQTDVAARVFFAQQKDCSRDRPIRIDVAAPTRLVFDAQDNDEYVMRGCSLHIAAKTVVLRGDVVLRSFDASFRVPDISFVPPPGSHGKD